MSSECLINDRLYSLDKKSEKGFMGATHAISAVAVFLAAIAFIPEQTFQLLGTSNIWVVLLAIIVTAGGALIPDLDNTMSTSKSALGPVGDALSVVFRSSSVAVQTIIRTKKDEKTTNPHRKFWHTIPAAMLLGGLVFLGSEISKTITLPFIGERTIGWFIALIVAWLLLHIGLSGLARDFMRKVKKSNPLGEFIALGISLSLTLVVFFNIPEDLNFWWLGVALAVGMVIHVLGDCCTTSGAPIGFPVVVFFKGRFWWNTRFSNMKAGGSAEPIVFGVFILVCMVSIIKIIGLF